MSVREFFIRLPYFCGSDDPEYYSEPNEVWFDHEKRVHGSSMRMQKKYYNDPFKRVRLAFVFTQGKHNVEVTDYCKKLATLCVMAHRQKSHGEIVFDSRIADLVIDLQELEPLYPEVSAVLTVEEASTNSNWI